jgi:hypothetical protein
MTSHSENQDLDIEDDEPVAVTSMEQMASSLDSDKNVIMSRLRAAQQKVVALGHNKRNDFQKFNYVSAEAFIAACKDALTSSGLTLVTSFTGVRPIGETMFIASRMLRLNGMVVHETEWVWSIEEKGRPPDKALAAAHTSSFAYALRDLLIVPRVSKDEAARMIEHAAKDDFNDESNNPQQPEPVARAKPKPADVKIAVRDSSSFANGVDGDIDPATITTLEQLKEIFSMLSPVAQKRLRAGFSKRREELEGAG